MFFLSASVTQWFKKDRLLFIIYLCKRSILHFAFLLLHLLFVLYRLYIPLLILFLFSLPCIIKRLAQLRRD